MHGVHAFEYPKSYPKFNDVFNKAMLNHTTVVMKKILENYKGFEDLKTLVDFGGGLGVNLKMITSKYPTIKGISFDFPHVVRDAPSYPGVEHVGGDMFESAPEGDAIFMKNVDEEPNRNYFGLRFLIPLYLNAGWELIRSFAVGYIYGHEYEECWESIMLRARTFSSWYFCPQSS